MIRLWEFLWHGCWHKWGEPYGTRTRHYWTSDERTYINTTQMARCEKCRRHKNVVVPE